MQALGTMIGLAPKLVKFWFQNRRSQVKVVYLSLHHDTLMLY
jgi:hypothetical protein